MTKRLEIDAKDEEFLQVLEKGIRDVLKSKASTPAEKIQAINAGSRLMAIRHKVGGGEDDNFFGR